MAAQPLVRRALDQPADSFATNVMGTVHLLDALRHAPDVKAVLVVTTDKVYANDESGVLLHEADRLGGKDPYSASKAACEIATASMADCYLVPRGTAVATARGGNVIGGGDFSADRLVPDVVRAVRSGTALRLRDPTATRPWQHVLDCVGGYLAYLRAMASGRAVPRALNFGPPPGQDLTVGQLADRLIQALGTPLGIVRAAGTDGREARTLRLDPSLARRTIGWAGRFDGERMMTATAAWYRAWADGMDMRAMTARQIDEHEGSP